MWATLHKKAPYPLPLTAPTAVAAPHWMKYQLSYYFFINGAFVQKLIFETFFIEKFKKSLHEMKEGAFYYQQVFEKNTNFKNDQSIEEF